MTLFVQVLDLGGAGPSVAVKDTIDIAGFPTRAGSRALENVAPATVHAEVVEHLLAHGYHVVGKTNLHELAFGTTGVNLWTGTPLNYRYPAYVPGGSSSGSAASVAIGQAKLALGTDTGGSIRVPAACCGVFGLKPSFGRVSRQGVMPAVSSLDSVGPFAADMDTLVAGMRAIDPSFGDLPTVAGVSVGVLDVPASDTVRQAVNEALAESGLVLCHLRLEKFKDAYDAGMVIINVETWAACGGLISTGLVGQDVMQRLLAASRWTTDDVARAEGVRRDFTAEVDAALEKVSILALPTLPEAPPRIERAADTTKLLSMTSLVRPFNLSGHPAISIPLKPSGDFPISLQLVAAKGADELLCAVATHISRQLNPNPLWRTPC